ncbi:MAG: alpha/beta hydrolase [Betaproteobacteria bacterium]|jgi:pimeloyl-ACP methyl ester carboxylesterase|nr:alpha/beta hydrolase [Burkholderiales bacterium]NBX15165.1 alpha/beta hydrolase [Betaproteobacteria bacterium]NBX89707.1 alpha/beta hydrolase [Betaproteobacteria bacterium]
MIYQVQGAPLYAYTGGKEFKPELPTVVFIHGVLNDHSVWILQSRYFANHGWNVLAIDLPGHCRSAGQAPQTVQEAADAVIALLDAAGVAKAVLVGHSFGSLIALEASARHPERVQKLVLVGIAYPMRVSPALLENSLKNPAKAIHMVNVFSHSSMAPPPSALGPGTWLHGGSQALMRKVLASNTQVNIFHRGFIACDQYDLGEVSIAKVTCPILFMLGSKDQMTPAKAAQSLIQKAAHAQVVLIDAGHQMMTEAPDAVLSAMFEFTQK